MQTQVAEGVFCYSGKEYADRPVSILFEGQLLEIYEIVARWRTPDGRCFRVAAVGGRVFDLYYSETNDDWKIREH